MKTGCLFLAIGFSPAVAFTPHPAPGVLSARFASSRASAPLLAESRFQIRRKVKTFAKGIVRPFTRDRKEEVVEEVVEEVEEEIVLPPPVVLDKKNLSAVDSFLVQMGVKTEDECTVPEEGEDLMEQIKCAGRAGIISYILWEWAFWIGAGGIAALTYYQATGGWPDLSNPDDQAKVGASAFALVNVARFAVPLRIGLALGTTPWVDENLVQPFLGEENEDSDGRDGDTTASEPEPGAKEA